MVNTTDNPWPYPAPVEPVKKRRPRWVLPAAFVATFLVGLMCGIAAANGPSRADEPVAQSSPATTEVGPSTGYTPPPPASPTAEPQEPVVEPVGPLREISSREWAQLAKAPDQHVGERVVVFGRVTQFDSVTGASTFRADVDGERHKQWYDYDTNTVLTGEAGKLTDVVTGDLFRAEVTVLGSLSYTTTMGGSTNVPQLVVEKIEVIGSADI